MQLTNFIILQFVGQKRAPEVSSPMLRILAESTALQTKATFHQQAMLAHNKEKKKHEEEYDKHEKEWREINAKLAENLERARRIQEEQILARTREYFVITT